MGERLVELAQLPLESHHYEAFLWLQTRRSANGRQTVTVWGGETP